MADAHRISKIIQNIDEESVKDLYAERAKSRAAVDVDAPVVLASDEDLGHIKEWNEYEVNHWLPYLKLDESSRVLELGFGTGRIAKYIIPLAGRYVGIDFVPEFVEAVRNRSDIDVKNGEAPVFMQGSFKELVGGKLDLPVHAYNRFVISGGVLMYINDDEVRSGLKKLVPFLADETIVYISEPIAIKERLTLNKYFSETMQSEYSAIYRTESEYMDMFWPFFASGFDLKVSEEFFEDDIKGQKETRQWMFVIKR